MTNGHVLEIMNSRIDGLAQDCSKSIANPLEKIQFCTHSTDGMVLAGPGTWADTKFAPHLRTSIWSINSIDVKKYMCLKAKKQ